MVDETDQGLGETLILNSDKTRLVICAPRYKVRNRNFCEMTTSDVSDMSNVRGICYEFKVDDWSSDPMITTHNHCDVSKWQDVEAGENENLETFKIEMTSGFKFTCLQLDISTSSSTGQFPISGNGFDITYNKTSEADLFNFFLKLPESDEIEFKCSPEGVAFGRFKPNSAVNELRVYCNGMQLEAIDLKNKLSGHLLLAGPSSWWEESFTTYTKLKDRRNELKKLGSCMLGYSGWFDQEDNLVLSAPVYNNKGTTYSGTLFFANSIFNEEEMNKIEHIIVEKGLVYRSIRVGNSTWSAMTGISSQTSSPSNLVIILKDRVYHSVIDEESSRTGFGRALAFWNSGNITQLVVSAPLTTQDRTFDCGIVYVYSLQKLENGSEQFQLEHSIRTSSCGGFGAVVADIGDIDGDSFTDIAVGSVYDNSVHIIRGGETGVQSSVSQTIRPQEPLKEYDNMFGFAISGHGRLLVISDPMANKIYLYRTLDVLDLSSDITGCADKLDIDTQEETPCKVCITLSPRSNSQPSHAVNVSLSWSINHRNITEVSRKKSKVTDLSDSKCFDLKFVRRSGSDIRHFDLSSDVEIEFSFRQGPDPAEGRVVAIAPETLTKKTHTVSTTGRCGNNFCEADFEIATEWEIERNEQTELFKTISNKTVISKKELYFGSGKEILVINVSIEALKGSFTEGKYSEQLIIDLGENLKVVVPITECNLHGQKSKKITIDLTEAEECSVGAVTCEGDEVFSCSKLTVESPGDKRSFQLRIPVNQTKVYLQDSLQVNMIVLSRRSIETNQTNNALTVDVGVSKVLDFEAMSSLMPANVTGIRLRNYKSSSRTLQKYGPDQTLTIQLKNRGVPTIDHAEVSVMYPVQYLGQDMIYIANITSTHFNCSQDTNRALNYRNLIDIYNSEVKQSSGKFTSLPLEKCGDAWKCLLLTCTVGNIRSGRENSLMVKTYLNAEAVSQHPNITYIVSYIVTLRDHRSVYTDKTVEEEIRSVMEVIPGIVGTLWYIVAGVGGGSLLLVILVVILIRCGFFSRKDRDQVKLLRKATVEATALTTGVVKITPPEHLPEPPPSSKKQDISRYVLLTSSLICILH